LFIFTIQDYVALPVVKSDNINMVEF